MKTAEEQLEWLRIQQKKDNNLHKPLFYRLNKSADVQEFNKLLNLPGIRVVDYISDQVREFVKYKNPDKKFSTDELDLEAKQHFGETEPDKYGVWVYYPWSNRLVHI